MSFNSATLNTITSDTDFRAYVQFISNGLEAGGVIKTADTGQVDTATVTFPGTTNTVAGYEIRRFSDALQSTYPIFFKLEYGRGGGANRFGFWITVGTGSDGAGNITGIKFTRTIVQCLWQNQATGVCYVTAGLNYFAYVMPTGTVDSQIVSFERTRDSAGSSTGEGLIWLYRYMPNGTTAYQVVQGFTSFGSLTSASEDSGLVSLTAIHPSGGALIPKNQVSGLGEAPSLNVAVYPCYIFGVGRTLFPMRNLVAGFKNDFATETTVNIKIYGITQQVRVLSHNTHSNILARGYPGSGIICTLLRYD